LLGPAEDAFAACRLALAAAAAPVAGDMLPVCRFSRLALVRGWKTSPTTLMILLQSGD